MIERPTRPAHTPIGKWRGFLSALSALVMVSALIGMLAAAKPTGGVQDVPKTESMGSIATLSGRVEVFADPPSPPVTLSPYARRRYQPPQNPGAAGGSEDAFVYLEPLSGSASSPPDQSTRILQRDRTIIPHVSVAQVGQLVEFPNEDDIFHNLFSLSPGNRFSLGRYAPGVTETNVFGEPGVVRLFCDIHAEMAGVILVVDTPWVTRVAADGSYRLRNVPAGRYRVIAWHPTARPDTVEIALTDGIEATRNFTLAPAQ